MNALLVFVGGGLGALLRYGVGLALPRADAAAFPTATLAVNLAGSLLIGAVAGALAAPLGAGPLSGLPLAGREAARAFGVVGVLGGFTTFSTFSLDTLALVQAGRTGTALAYVVASVLGGLALAALGAMATAR